MNEKLKIMDVAKKEEKLSIFTKALTATGLDGKLREQGPFTILAPTNTAFSEFPGVEDLLSSKKKDQLKDLLASQIIKGKLRFKDLTNQASFETLSGAKLVIKGKEGLGIDDTKVVKADIETANGFLHMFDAVVMPRTASQTISILNLNAKERVSLPSRIL